MARQPAHGVSLHRVYGKGNFLDAVAGAALERPLLKAELAGRDSNQSHLVFAGRTRRSLTNRRCHHSHANRGWGPEQEIPDPCTDRNDSLKVRRLVSAVPTIIGKSHGALTVSNLSQLGVLSSVYNHFPSDHTKGALAVRYFSVEVCVGRGVDSFPKNGGCPVNSVGACVICIPKLTASPVLRQLSVQKLMEIESRHRSLFDPRPARWKLAHSTLGCTSSHRALIPLMHVDRTRPQGCSGCLILVALPAVARLAAIRAMSTKSREVLFGSRISGAKLQREGANAPNRPCARRTRADAEA